MLIKEIKEDKNKCRNKCWVYGLEDSTTVKMSILPKLIQRFNTFVPKLQQGFFFIDKDKIILKFIQKSKGTGIAKTVLLKKEKWEESFFC